MNLLETQLAIMEKKISNPVVELTVTNGRLTIGNLIYQRCGGLNKLFFEKIINYKKQQNKTVQRRERLINLRIFNHRFNFKNRSNE